MGPSRNVLREATCPLSHSPTAIICLSCLLPPLQDQVQRALFSAPVPSAVCVVMRMCDSAIARLFLLLVNDTPLHSSVPPVNSLHPCPWLPRLPFFSNLSLLVLLLVISLKTYKHPKDNSRHFTGAGTTVSLLLQLTGPLSPTPVTPLAYVLGPVATANFLSNFTSFLGLSRLHVCSNLLI